MSSESITTEANFDGLVGPTHNYAGLSAGNIASSVNAGATSNPKAAALQGLEKMKNLHDLGFIQGVLAPQERPDITTLKRLGFTGSDAQILQSAAKQAPMQLAACYSASSMWTANAATVSPSADCADGRVHFTPANLNSMFHRSIEQETTERILQSVFNNDRYFAHHPALPANDRFADEGAANHTRFCHQYGDPGIAFFVYGKSGFDHRLPKPSRYAARQTLEASQAIARLHELDNRRVIYAQQNPAVIDQGVFHNDVIAVGNRHLLFCHEQAFLDQQGVYQQLQNALGDVGLSIIEVPDNRISVKTAVESYLFNSQLLSLPDGKTLIAAPAECQKHQAVWSYLEELVSNDSPVGAVQVFDLHQSMSNGGGPACLRLRVVLNEAERNATNHSCLMSDSLYSELTLWVKKHYRDRLSELDFADHQLLIESRTALDELTSILQLGSIYPFQQ